MKFNLGYKKLSCIKTSSNYLNYFCKDVFVMIKQLGLPMFFMMFTIGVNNWPILVKILKELFDQCIGENVKMKKIDSLSIMELVRNDHVTCARYYEHRINSFHKLI